MRVFFALVLGVCSGSAVSYVQRVEAEDVGSTEPMSEARGQFIAGRDAFEEGRFDAALKYFEASYELSGKPALLYNIGQCHDRLRQDEAAIASFERYLNEEPESDHRSAVEARLRALRNAVAARSQAARATLPSPTVQQDAAAPHNAPHHPSRSNTGRIGSISLLSAGLGLSLTGAVLMALGQGHANDVEHARVGVSYRSLKDDRDVAERQWMAGEFLVSIGCAAGVSGLVWLLVDVARASRDSRIDRLANERTWSAFIAPRELRIARSF
jgi:tetratricopeptide (TPR) repeat protein